MNADPHDDSIDYARGWGRMIEAVLPYWEQQSSMPPEQAIRKLISEHEVMYSVLSEMAGGVDAHEPYSAWAERVVGAIDGS